MSKSDSINLKKTPHIISNCNRYELAKDGVTLIPNFLSKEKLQLINAELDNLFETPSFNGSLGCKIMFKKNSKKYLKKILIPELTVRSINLLELAVDINNFLLDHLKEKNNNNCLSALEIIEEINPVPLFWHTDNREGMLRAFIYLEGGNEESGAFEYMIGTHKREYFVEHKLTDSQINKLSKTIITAKGGPGDLVIANTVGFHANKPRLKKRRIIRFEFHPKSADYQRSPICLTSFSLSNKIKMNLDLFDQERLGKRNDYVKSRDYSLAAIQFIAKGVFFDRFSRYQKTISNILKKVSSMFKK